MKMNSWSKKILAFVLGAVSASFLSLIAIPNAQNSFVKLVMRFGEERVLENGTKVGISNGDGDLIVVALSRPVSNQSSGFVLSNLDASLGAIRPMPNTPSKAATTTGAATARRQSSEFPPGTPDGLGVLFRKIMGSNEARPDPRNYTCSEFSKAFQNWLIRTFGKSQLDSAVFNRLDSYYHRAFAKIGSHPDFRDWNFWLLNAFDDDLKCPIIMLQSKPDDGLNDNIMPRTVPTEIYADDFTSMLSAYIHFWRNQTKFNCNERHINEKAFQRFMLERA